MPEPTRDLPLQTTQNAAFTLPCPVARGITYLSDPEIVLSALPSVERIVLRQRGSYRLTLAPIHLPGHALRPAVEIVFEAAADRVTIRSVDDTPFNLQSDEVAADVVSAFRLRPTATGCAVEASLQLAATIPGHTVPTLMPRIIARRTAEAMLVLRMKQEVQGMTRALLHGFPIGRNVTRKLPRDDSCTPLLHMMNYTGLP